jgi:hypothetical protein
MPISVRHLLFLFWRQQPVTLRATPRCSLSSHPHLEPPFVCACTLAFGEGFSDMCLRSLPADILAHMPRAYSAEAADTPRFASAP